MEGELLTVREAARVLGVSKQYVRRLIARGKLGARRYGRQWLIKAQDAKTQADVRKNTAAPRSWKIENCSSF